MACQAVQAMLPDTYHVHNMIITCSSCDYLLHWRKYHLSRRQDFAYLLILSIKSSTLIICVKMFRVSLYMHMQDFTDENTKSWEAAGYQLIAEVSIAHIASSGMRIVMHALVLLLHPRQLCLHMHAMKQ